MVYFEVIIPYERIYVKKSFDLLWPMREMFVVDYNECLNNNNNKRNLDYPT